MIYKQYLYIIDESNISQNYEIKINNLNKLKGIKVLNSDIEFKGTIYKEKEINVCFQIKKEIMPFLNDRNILEIECTINNNTKKLKLEINSNLYDEQKIRICYQIKSGNNIIENNITCSQIKNKNIILYNGILNDFNCELNYNEHKIYSLYDKEIFNKDVCYDPLLNKKEFININNFNFEDKKQRIKIMLYGVINESIDWYPLTRDFKGKFIEWYSYYKKGNFEANLKYIIGNFRNEYNDLEKKCLALIIFFI